MKRLLTKAEFIRNYNRIFPLVVSFADQHELPITLAAGQLCENYRHKITNNRKTKGVHPYWTLGQGLILDVLEVIERFGFDVAKIWKSFNLRQRKTLESYARVCSLDENTKRLFRYLDSNYTKSALKPVSPITQTKQALPASLQLVNDKIRDLGETCYGTKEAIAPTSDIGND
jgi:hypothetical protein